MKLNGELDGFEWFLIVLVTLLYVCAVGVVFSIFGVTLPVVLVMLVVGCLLIVVGALELPLVRDSRY